MDVDTLLKTSKLPRHEAERLLQSVTGITRAALFDVDLDAGQVSDYQVLAGRRSAGEPLQYVEGSAAFGPIEVAVDPRVLIPRPETEQVWERAMALLGDGPCRVVDLCTGSGCIALATKKRRPDDIVVGTDVSAPALDVAKTNAAALDLSVEFLQGDLFGALSDDLAGRVDLIVTNPPYVSPREWNKLPHDVRDHEPRSALVADENGLAFYRRLANEADGWLSAGGAIVAEIGETQGDAVKSLFVGWSVEIERDLADRDRILVATMSG